MLPSLADFVGMYALSTDLQPCSVDQLRFAVLSLDRWAACSPEWHGGPVLLSDLADDFLNRWLTDLLASGMARKTVRNRRGNIVTLWRAAADALLVSSWPRRVKTIKLPRTLPEAWSRSQVELLVQATEKLTGTFPGGLCRRATMRAIILADFATGLRPCDLLRLRQTDVSPDGCIAIIQHKTGWPVLCRLEREEMAAIAATFPPDRKLLFPLDRKLVHFWMRRLCTLAGLPGTTKWLRRSGATAVEDAFPGSAQQYLGQKTPGLAWRHYIDPRLLTRKQFRPPPLTG